MYHHHGAHKLSHDYKTTTVKIDDDHNDNNDDDLVDFDYDSNENYF